MKNLFSITFLLISSLAMMAFMNADSDTVYRKLKNKHFGTGEEFVYVTHYLGFNGGKAHIKVDDRIHTVNGRPCYQVEVFGKTTGMAALFYHVKDLWRSHIDTAAITTQKFHRDIEEGKNYTLVETTTFDHKKGKGYLKQVKRDKKKPDKEFDIPAYPQDMISGYYYLRTIDYANKTPGDIISMNAVYEDTVYDFKVRYLGRDQVKTKMGKMNVFALSPIMPENKLFDGGDAITIWVSDDKNRVPVRVKAKMFLGAVIVELTDHSGLKHEFNLVD